MENQATISNEVNSDVSVDTGSNISNGNINSIDTRKIKIDGEYVEVPLSKLEEAYGLDRASRKRFEEASGLRKQVDEFIDSMKNGQLDNLLEIVPEDKLYDFAEKMLRKKIEWEETPEDKKARIMAERERDKYKKELEDYSKKEQQYIQETINNRAVQEIDEEITSVIEELEKTHGKMVKSPEFIQDIARTMLAQLDKGAAKATAKEASELALKSWRKRIGSYVNNISHEDLRKYLSKEQIEALRKSDLDNALSQFPSNKREKNDFVTPKKKGKVTTTKDFFDQLDKRFG